MKLFLNILFIFCFFCFNSCIPDAEYRNLESPSVFKGNWEGSYSGDDNGIIIFNVSNSGGFFGDKISNSGKREGFNGYAKIGSFIGTSTSYYVFTSKSTPNNYEILGEWSKNSLKGTFVVKKK